MRRLDFRIWELGLVATATVIFGGALTAYLTNYPVLKHFIAQVEEEGEEEIGHIGSMTGSLRRQILGQSEFRLLTPEDVLFQKDVVITGPDGNALLLLDDGSSIDLGPSTMVRLATESKLSLGGVSRRTQIEVVSGTVTPKLAAKSEGDLVIKSRNKSITVSAKEMKEKPKLIKIQVSAEKIEKPKPKPSPKKEESGLMAFVPKGAVSLIKKVVDVEEPEEESGSSSSPSSSSSANRSGKDPSKPKPKSTGGPRPIRTGIAAQATGSPGATGTAGDIVEESADSTEDSEEESNDLVITETVVDRATYLKETAVPSPRPRPSRAPRPVIDSSSSSPILGAASRRASNPSATSASTSTSTGSATARTNTPGTPGKGGSPSSPTEPAPSPTPAVVVIPRNAPLPVFGAVARALPAMPLNAVETAAPVTKAPSSSTNATNKTQLANNSQDGSRAHAPIAGATPAPGATSVSDLGFAQNPTGTSPTGTLSAAIPGQTPLPTATATASAPPISRTYAVRLLEPARGFTASLKEGTTQPELPIRFRWSSNPPDLQGELIVKEAEGGQREVFRHVIRPHEKLTALDWVLKSAGSYTWEIRAPKGKENEVTIASNPRKQSFELKGEYVGLQSFAPKLILSESTPGDFGLLMRWNAFPGATSYEVEVTGQGIGKNGKKVFLTREANQLLSGEEITAIGKLSYTVSTKLPRGFVVRSKPVAFQLVFPPPLPSVPKEGAVFSMDKIKNKGEDEPAGLLLTWHVPDVPGDYVLPFKGYEVEVAEDPAFRDIVHTVSEMDNFTPFVTENTRTYWWRVRAVGAKTKSAWTKPRSFKLVP